MKLLPIILITAIAIPVLRAIFSLFRRQSPSTPELTTEETLVSIQEHIPAVHKTSEHFKNAAEHVAHHQFALAIKSFIALANESGHYFSGGFWLNLANCAVALQMPAEADYCRQRVINDRQEISDEIPYGFTTVKLDDTHHQLYVANAMLEELANKRRKKDGLHKLLRKDGFYLKADNRTGTIYYINNGNVLEIEIELAASARYEWLVYFDDNISWAIPAYKPLNPAEKSAIKTKLVAWLNAKKIKTDINT